MLLDVLKVHALRWIPVQQSADEVSYLSTEERRELYGDLQNLIVGLVFISLGLERRLSCGELIAENAQAPNICLFVIVLANDYFRRNVVESSTEGLPLAE